MKTRIDFHSNVGDQLDYACRLIRKALAKQNRVTVYHQDAQQLTRFDQLLWGFSATDFLPHVALKQGGHPLAAHTPVLLTLAADMTVHAPQQSDILVNLSETVPTHFSQFERLIEVVPQETDTTKSTTQAGRDRYRFYQQQGYQPNHINAK